MQCDNCGAADDRLEPVHRLYLVPELVRVEDQEWWCPACRSQYPHEEAAEAPSDP
ncbi:MAG: hypothetical protein J2P57_18565 [Acidimicrobiaceae bacterium]|nr:hypothetical protein [Acidimicrobiaceae bacterium]